MQKHEDAETTKKRPITSCIRKEKIRNDVTLGGKKGASNFGEREKSPTLMKIKTTGKQSFSVKTKQRWG